MSNLKVRLHLEELETRAVPASPVLTLNALGNRGSTAHGFENASAGRSVHGVGDVNGDGFADYAIGAPYATAGGTLRGAAYVVFGGPNQGGGMFTLNALGTAGFTINGFENSAEAGFSVSGAGDVNGDGFADLIVSAPIAAAGGTQRGAAYVVFGGNNLAGSTVVLNALGSGGFTLNGFENSARAGISVSGAGDVNGDGFADLIIGAPAASGGGTQRGAAYVVFGGNNLAGSTVVLNALGTGGFTVNGFETGAYAGGSVSGAGDVNGDGFADVIIGAPFATAGGSNRGAAYVVFGGNNLVGSTVVLNALGAGGFSINGLENFAEAGFSVSGAADVNGDGFADLIIGAPFATAGGTQRGAAYVVFGGTNQGGSTVTLNAPGIWRLHPQWLRGQRERRKQRERGRRCQRRRLR